MDIHEYQAKELLQGFDVSVPRGRRMGHAGAIVSAFGESAAEKVEILKEAGVTVAANPSEMGTTVAAVLAGG